MDLTPDIPEAMDLRRKCSFMALTAEQQNVVLQFQHQLIVLMKHPRPIGSILLKREGVARSFLSLSSYFSLYGYELKRIGPDEILIRWCDKFELDTTAINLR